MNEGRLAEGSNFSATDMGTLEAGAGAVSRVAETVAGGGAIGGDATADGAGVAARAAGTAAGGMAEAEEGTGAAGIVAGGADAGMLGGEISSA